MHVGWAPVHLFILARERKMLLFFLPGHSWDHTGWIEPCIALISTTVQMGWVSTEPLQGTSGWAGAARTSPQSLALCRGVPPYVKSDISQKFWGLCLPVLSI